MTRVVAGYDGSDQAKLAVTWAAREAACRGCGLTLVQVTDSPADVEPLVADVRHAWPALEVDTRAESGRPADVLVRVAADADLLVIGSSGRTGLPRMVLGSTAAELLHTCGRPIVVVRNVPVLGGRVVVGVDGSSTSVRAIEFAFEFAARHDCDVLAVHAWTELPMDALEPVRAWDEDWSALRRKGQELLAESLTDCQNRYPNVVVERIVSFDRPAHALLEHATDAALLVVGSHGRGTLRRMLLGSVSHAMVYHAPCPVAVLRATS